MSIVSRPILRPTVALVLLAAVTLSGPSGCATAGPGVASPAAPGGGAAVADSVPLCAHRVPAEECTACHPELAANFRKMHDWCAEHGLPESHCRACHPGLVFERLPALPADADLVHVSTMGEDVPALAAHAAAGKVTIFDFFAPWCAPCKQVDRHVYALLRARKDVAYRKLNIESWDTPLARRYMATVPTLPYVVVYGKTGAQVTAIAGLDLPALDRAIATAAGGGGR